MSKYIKIALGKPLITETEDEGYNLFRFIYYLAINKREWTGYKELERWGVDRFFADTFTILKGPTITGSYSFLKDEIENFVGVICCNDDLEYYWLDVECYFNGEDVIKIFKERNPVWLIPANEFEVYDEALLNDLTSYGQNRILRPLVGDIRYLPFKEDVEERIYTQLSRAYENGKIDKQPNHLLEWFFNKDWVGDVCNNVEIKLEELYNVISDQTNKERD